MSSIYLILKGSHRIKEWHNIQPPPPSCSKSSLSPALFLSPKGAFLFFQITV
jgi:hypothetical protein